MGGKISPSLMCADFLNLRKDIELFEKTGIEYLHIDIMDGEFVPNFTLGTDYIKALHRETHIPLDIHLMIGNPENKLDWFELREGDFVSVHYESTRHIQRCLQKIRDKGAKPMLALNPGTPLLVLEDLIPDIEGVLIMTVNPGFAGQKLIPSTLDKIRRLKEMNYNLEIEVDGNVSFENAKKMRAAGADIFVAGTSSIFIDGANPEKNIEKLREVIKL